MQPGDLPRQEVNTSRLLGVCVVIRGGSHPNFCIIFVKQNTQSDFAHLISSVFLGLSSLPVQTVFTMVTVLKKVDFDLLSNNSQLELCGFF